MGSHDSNSSPSSFWGVFWVNASSQETAEQAFCDLARIEKLEEKFESGLHWLSRQKLPWLLVIDNANDATLDYARYFPSGGKGHILVTSRNPDCKVHATVGFEEFVSLEESDAITLLLRSAIVGDPRNLDLRRSALPIVEALGCLPLAVIQAGASIRQNICSLEEYLDIFNSYKKMIFSNERQQGKGCYAYTIFTTFEVSFNEISRLGTQEARDAIEMLQFMAFLHYDQIPEVLFETAWENMLGYMHQASAFTLDWVVRILGDLVTISTSYWGWFTFLADGRLPQIFSQSGKRWDKVRFRKAILLLRSYSLIFQNIVEGSYSMHPMVQFWARERLKPRAQKLWGNMAAKILAEGITMTANESDVVYRRHLITHIDSCLKIDSVDSRQGLEFEDSSIRQFAKFAALYSEGGRWLEASNIQERLLQNRRRTLGKDCNEVLEIMSSLSQSYWNASEIQKALKIQTMLLDLCNDKLGPFDPKTLQAMDMLGRTRWLCGSISEANELGKQAYESSIKILGVDHPISLGAMHNYGRACLHMGSFKKSQVLLMKAWEGRIKLLGETDLNTLETMQDLAMSCLALKEVDEAASLVSFVLDARKRLLGPEHAHTLWSINDLSKVYCTQGYPGDAVELLIPTREIASRTLGTTHIGTTMTIFNLAHAYTLMGELGQAEAILTELIQTESKSLGPKHPDVFSAKIQLAIVFKNGGLLRKAARVSQEALEDRIAIFGLENPRTVQAKQLNDEISQGVELLEIGVEQRDVQLPR